jgi:3-hydroxyisobutyrate dehydrogenase-like beta-hydroxyacid dehydrogenase
VIAVVGTGNMGAAMVRRLRQAGHRVIVFNRTRSRAVDLASATGAELAETARDAAAEADIVVVSLADDAAVERTYRNADGLVAGLRAGTVVLETSTIAPETVHTLAPLVDRRSAELLDAPVSGSVPIVERGQLTFMVGGSEAALDRVRPIMDVLAGKVFHMGGHGAGATMKLAVNAALHALNQGLAEALVLAERAGVTRAAAYEVFAASALAGPFVHYKREAYEHPESAPAVFTLDLVAKDLALIEALAEAVGVPMAQLATGRQVVQRAIEAGYGERDLSALAVYLRDTAESTTV